jgi:hypothetical protein
MECPFYLVVAETLNHGYIHCGRTLFALLNIECYPVALFKGLESTRINPRMMYKNIRSVFLLNEAKTFLVTKPFHNPFCHFALLFFVKKHSCYDKKLYINMRLIKFVNKKLPTLK